MSYGATVIMLVQFCMPQCAPIDLPLVTYRVQFTNLPWHSDKSKPVIPFNINNNHAVLINVY